MTKESSFSDRGKVIAQGGSGTLKLEKKKEN